ncbi:probable leucine-rich repeat receptor-like serine/threonine-protein kinase At3g14840 [Arachis stenosperma]|uniref:probable leucine-rich repeat receptor-like serine/threonine-protein kinase At3g14840 n=1 Tax=Arachis stenosperma TaxID=217475 RepID=UPI0025AC5244|nr:probable leucine-rich repeat receptor-like serine/threonine-protein kinase At3g14840 [Arachis stenosperma]
MISPYCFFFLLLLAAFGFSSQGFGATQLPENEVQTLQSIAKTLGIKNWNPSVDECNKRQGRNDWSSCWEFKDDEYQNVVICNCSIDTVCHVTNLCMKRQNLPGTLPPELVRLPYLQEIDLTLNYLNGTIPREWGSLNLLNITLGGNRLTGPIPKEIANISTLKSFVAESNQLYGDLPPELGNLTQIQRLILSSNNFTGELPATLAKLTNLQDIRLGDNQFSGKIPDFIESWTNLKTLNIIGSGLSGPIPSGISKLRNLIDLRISDLSGSEISSFPDLSNKSMKYLILRNCNIHGTLKDYLSTTEISQILDLSFNKLTGPIPPSYKELIKVNYIFLTGNLLNGSVPSWKSDATSLDLSYNNFNKDNQQCQYGKVNLFAASSPTINNSGIVSCLRSSVSDCSKVNAIHINCGGTSSVKVKGITYDEDGRDGTALFDRGQNRNWAVSTTGDYMDVEAEYSTASLNDTSALSSNDAYHQLYKDARVSPISLTYYGFCLHNGNYKVKLHFAEIMFTNDQTYKSLGRRLFHIYIQGTLVEKDFNIAKEAGGVGKAIVKAYTAAVTNNTIEIRFYWAGKGTTIIPKKSVYGPLISAISVENENGGSISRGAVIGIVAAVVIIIIILVLSVLWWKGYLGKKNSPSREFTSLDIQTSLFSLRQIKIATNNFDISNKIGEGGFGPVYKGELPNGTIIAVKQLSSKSRQGNREFLNEIGMISALQHPCLVKLYGCCVEGDQLLLVYEYMQNNSLARALFGPKEHQIKLDWPTRQNICIGIARGLAYLHEESRLKIVHRDIKATNVLLDRDLNPKISDFGLAKLDEEDNTHISTRIAGTYGYMAPEYAMHGYLTDKADVYSFGIVALEIITGKTNTTLRQKEEVIYLLDLARLLKEKGNLMELVDRRLGSNFDKEEAMIMIKVALLCTNVSATLRPNMSSVVSMLEGKIIVQEPVFDKPSDALDEKKLEAMRLYCFEDQSISMEDPWTTSSTSARDLYPLNLDSSYLEKREY